VALALAGLLLVHRMVPEARRESANAVTGITYGATYVIYGITLAFSLYLGNQDFTAARQTAESEAASLEGIFEIAAQLPQPEGGRIQGLVESYARAVAEEEWTLMADTAVSPESERAAALVDELQSNLLGFRPDTGAEDALYSQALTLVYDLEEQREVRLLQSRQDSHRLLWYVLVAGGAITVVHALFFETRPLWLQALSVAALTAVVVLVLTATYQLQAPFSGTVRVEPVAFEEVLDDIRRQRQVG
jgi:hypothetical protein